MNPVDEYISSKNQTEKTADFGSVVKNVFGTEGSPERTRALIGGAATLAGSFGAYKGGQKVYYAITKKRDFDKMMEVNPDLAEYHEADPKLFNQHFSSLRSMVPEFTAEPVVAGTYMRVMSSNPNAAGNVIIQALQHREPGIGIKDVKSGFDIMETAMKKPKGPSGPPININIGEGYEQY